MGIKDIKSLVPKNLNLDKLKTIPINSIDIAKNKISNFYNNFKKIRLNEKKKLEKKRKKEIKKK